MIQGCGSNVGKSLLVAGLIRAAKKRGLRVAPFKPQNMSNNAAITVDGGEAGRAQSFQAYAAGIDFHSDMNPVLLKPESMIGSQVILNGKKYKSLKAREYYSHKDKFIGIVIKSFRNLVNNYDLVIAEGAGSLAEVNLRKADIANMGFASVLSIPVIVAADIERGGVIAQLIGTKEVLDQNDINLIEGFIINKFRGDKSLFDDGVAFIEKKTNWRSCFRRGNRLPTRCRFFRCTRAPIGRMTRRRERFLIPTLSKCGRIFVRSSSRFWRLVFSDISGFENDRNA